MKILVVGGSGFIGRNLVELLIESHEVTVLDLYLPEQINGKVNFLKINLMQDFNFESDNHFDVVVNLAGVGIFRRWTRKNRDLIIKSRVIGTRNLIRALGKLSRRPKKFIQASAMGFYGDRGEELLTVKSSKGEGFLADLVMAWEAESDILVNLDICRIVVRQAVVFGESGYLATLKKLFSLGIGGLIGDGRQFIPWVDIDDLVKYYVHLIEEVEDSRIVHGQFSEAARQREVVELIGKNLGRRVFVRVPIWILALFFGGSGRELNFSQKTEPTQWRGAENLNLKKVLAKWLKN
jgi:uncharacterized protein (TIGR01777 family)